MLESADLSTTNQTLPQQSQHSGLAQRAAESPAPLSCAQEHASVPPTLSEHYHLLEIWEELLGTRPISMTDNFFALGNHRSLFTARLAARRLAARIEKVFGEKIALATLFAGPTIQQITQALRHQKGNMARTPLVAIQTEGDKRPLFFLHGDWQEGGLYCYQLARELGPDQPFYALHPYRLEGLQIPPTLEEVALAHIEAMRMIQPEGPYVLAGFCNGALCAGEMSRQLQKQGQQVHLLFLIDPLALPTIPQRLASKLFHRIGGWLGLSEGEQFNFYLRCYRVYACLREVARQIVSRDYRELAIKNWGKPNILGLSLPDRGWLTLSLEEMREDEIIAYHWRSPDRIPDVSAKKLVFIWTRDGGSARNAWDKSAQGKKADVSHLPYAHNEWTAKSIQAIAERLNSYLRSSCWGKS